MTATQIAFRLGAMRYRPKTWQEMQVLLGCSRPTAYRWLAFVKAGGELPMEAVSKERWQSLRKRQVAA